MPNRGHLRSPRLVRRIEAMSLKQPGACRVPRLIVFETGCGLVAVFRRGCAS